ncbi:isoprenyl transferase [Streptomyces sp. BE20]|uniref:isoprenyl transferase n=1 Tax=Streptomycetaceae TaxID=2062 RepID=UPI002E7820C7|nr:MULTISPECIES: isoprenyl transferase [unclassified Streptomyces]MED7953338.1 isoprenyl transferase [Streptomyces sp. BE303]MEE1828688.1 isoprenyl transferase [Streptomyces sp. BE20]
MAARRLFGGGESSWGSPRPKAGGEYLPPTPHPSGARPPQIPAELVPHHVAIVMDGNGRWAKERGLPRTEGHKVGEAVVLDVLKGAIELGVKNISLYAFSTENWKRSPDEVKFLMNFNRDVIHRRRDEMDAMGVRVRWAGRMPKLWKSVVQELQVAEEQTRDNDAVTLYMCVNYGGRAEIADAAAALAADVAAGKLDPKKVNEKTLGKYLYHPDMPDVDLFLRPSGEQRTSNFLLWQSAYAEFVFQDVLWPDFDRRDLWRACEQYARRDRRFGGAVPNEVEAGPELPAQR